MKIMKVYKKNIDFPGNCVLSIKSRYNDILILSLVESHSTTSLRLYPNMQLLNALNTFMMILI